jgi:MFS family permease
VSVGGDCDVVVRSTFFGGRRWGRQLAHYPRRRARYGYLALVVVVTIVVYYQQYVGGAVSTSVLAHFQISFRYYLTVIVVSNGAGAVASLVAGLADRWGRANLVAGGLLVAAAVTAFAIPAASSPTQYAVAVSAVGFVEGLVLVATPALVRDFSAQSGRGRAMGFWTLGPVMGSLVVAEVSSNTLAHLPAWQDQFRIAGIAGLVVGAVALVALRELSPGLRDQLMVTTRERVLVEARARGIDIEAALRRPWRQMTNLGTLVPALGVSLFLLIYYAAVAFFVVYFVTVFGFTEARANSVGNWFWAADAITVVVVGVLSDRVGVRKPFMVIGGLGAAVMTAIFATRATHPATTYDTLVVLVSILSVFRGMAYAPWMAAFTETVERRNPALVATGLALWGWILRLVVVVSFLILPAVVASVTPVADYGARVEAIVGRYGPEAATLEAIDPATRTALRTTPPPPSAVGTALHEIEARFHIVPAVAVRRLEAVRTMPVDDRNYLAAHSAQVVLARRQAPEQWLHWWWVCVVGEIVFLPTIWLLTGRWQPSTARRDAEEHRQMVDQELVRMAAGAGRATSTPGSTSVVSEGSMLQ